MVSPDSFVPRHRTSASLLGLGFLVLFLPSAALAQPAAFEKRIAGVSCPGSLVVTNTADSGAGSLRDAINQANCLGGPLTITFNIPGTGVQVIKPLSALPTILTPVTIDGYSQPGSSPNTLVNGDNAVVLIQIDGSLSSPGTDGLTINFAPNTLVRGLFVTKFSGNGIVVQFSNCTVRGNIIAFNGGAGVVIACVDGCIGSSDAILGNSIYSNGGLGISLGGGPTPLPNDNCDSDSGPSVANQGQNYPVLTQAQIQGSTTLIQGTLNSVANTVYHVELFGSPACDPSGNGEGQTFLGSTNVLTGPACVGSFNVTIPFALAAGQVVTATATDPNNNTSEYSACVTVTGGCSKPPAPPGLIVSPPVVPMGSIATLIWDSVPAFGGTYTVLYSKDNGVTFNQFASGLTNTTLSFTVNFAVGTTVVFEVLADSGCGANGISDPSPKASMQVVQTCPKPPDPVAQVDQAQVPVGNPWSLHWTPTLPAGPGGPLGMYVVLISEDNGLTYKTAGTTTNTTFTGPPVPQADLGKLVFLQVVAKPSCSTDDASAGHSNVVFFTVLPGCEVPQAARNASIQAASSDGHPINRPPYPTEHLSVSWDPPQSGAPPTGYLVAINGDVPVLVQGGTGGILPARGNADPVTLFVTSVNCNPQKQGPTIHSPTVALLLQPPGANFSTSPNPKVGQPVTLTDTSSPQATTWLWLFDDGSQSTAQSVSKLYTTAGTHTAALIATNGAGSGSVVHSFTVNAASSTVSVAAVSETVAFAETEPGRRRVSVDLEQAGAIWLQLSSRASQETTLFLRFLNESGNLVMERRLVVAQGATVTHDLAAFGLRGVYAIELVGDPSVGATIVRTGRSTREVRR
jgi:hypothetical protein